VTDGHLADGGNRLFRAVDTCLTMASHVSCDLSLNKIPVSVSTPGSSSYKDIASQGPLGKIRTATAWKS
jgi:hypothetical protein